MDEVKTGNISDILKLMNRANEGFAYEIFVPSLGKNVMFRQMTTSQQKRLLKAIIDSPAYNTEFIFALRGIIEENCVERIDVGALTIIDKLIISLKMRSISIGNEYTLKFKVPNSDKEFTSTIDLALLVDTAIEHSNIPSVQLKDDTNVYELYCSLPTIDDEYKLEDQLRRKNTKIDIKNEVELRETVGNVFVNELVKYIKKINIKDTKEDKVIEIDLKDIDFKNRIQILEQIPTLLIKKVIDYIGTVNKEVEKILLFKYTNEGVILEQRLKIDASFFTPS